MRRSTIRLALPLAVAMLAATLPSVALAATVDGQKTVVSNGPLAIDQPVPGHFASWSDFEDAQDAIDAVGTAILTASLTIPGYAGIEVSAEHNTLDLYWQGTLPDPIARIVKSSPVPVIVHRATYAQADLQTVTARITELPGVTQAGPRTDGSGLSVEVSRDTPQSTLDALAKDITVPFDVGSKEVTHFDSFNKTNDAPPYWGGAEIMWTSNGYLCSSGFAVADMVTGQQKMMTAGHCKPWGNTFDDFVDGGSDLVGQADNQQHTYDTVLIDTYTQGRIYTGNFNSSDSHAVKGDFPSFPGDVVCRSSAFSNQMCGLKVKKVGQSVKASGPEGSWTIKMMVEAEQMSGLSAIGNGDSGGPIFSGRSDGYVMARGIASGDDGDDVPCIGTPAATNRNCKDGLFYSDMFFMLMLNHSWIVNG